MFILSTLLHQLAKTNAGFYVCVFVTRKSWWVVLRGKPGGIFSKDVATWVWTVLTRPRITCSFLKMFYPIAGHIGTILATLSLSSKSSKTCLFGGFWLSKSRVEQHRLFLLGGLGRSLGHKLTPTGRCLKYLLGTVGSFVWCMGTSWAQNPTNHWLAIIYKPTPWILDGRTYHEISMDSCRFFVEW